MKMIVLNGPPRSGKDTFLKLLKAVFMDDLPTDKLVPFSYKWVLCEGVGKRYSIHPKVIWDWNANTLTKDTPKKSLGGKSVRQCLIYESEEVIKKELGEDGVALKTFENVKSHIKEWLDNPIEDCVLVTPDGGFESEMLCAMKFFGICRSDIFLIRFQRKGHTFEGDSRDFIASPNITIDNDGDKIDLMGHLQAVKNFIDRSRRDDLELNGGELDTLYQLVMNGPLESGDMPSKVGFVLLCKRGYAMRDSDSWLGYVTNKGIEKFKSLEWRGKLGSELLSKTQEYKCRQNPNDLRESRGTDEVYDVRGIRHFISK